MAIVTPLPPLHRPLGKATPWAYCDQSPRCDKACDQCLEATAKAVRVREVARAYRAFGKPLRAIHVDVLRLAEQGCDAKEISDRLCISMSTVGWRKQAIFGRLGVRNIREAVYKARQLGLLDGVGKDKKS